MGLVSLSILMIACSACLTHAKPTINVQAPPRVNPALLVDYLTKYGYLKPVDPRNGRIRTAAELKLAVRALQRFGGLSDDGDMSNPALVKLLNTSRCGVYDIGPSDVYKRRRRYAIQGSKWKKTGLTYRIVNYTPDLPREVVDKTIREALNMWASVTPLRFTEIKDPRVNADIRIKFVTGDHGDGYPFDGPGGTLAHAFYPHNNLDLSGDAHFDEAETFTLRSNTGIDLFWVAVHEFGHSLGLDHSNHQDAIMYPFYRGYTPNFKLHYDDIRGLQVIYGSNTAKPKPTVQPQTVTPHVDPTVASGVPDKCSTSLDAIVQTEDGYSYAFKGAYFWPVGDTGAWTGPLKIKDYWPLIEDDIDAAFYRNSDKMTFIIKGNKFWMFKSRTPHKPTALPLTDPELGLNADLVGMDAALQWARNGRIYFFKGSKYWRYDPNAKKLDVGYPRSIKEGWNGAVPDNINAAFQWKNEKSYFFKDTAYLAVDESSLPVKVLEAKPPYPRKIAHYWMACSPEKLVGGKISPVGNSAFGLIPNVLMFLASFVLTKLA